jgi:hypothetical protein
MSSTQTIELVPIQSLQALQPPDPPDVLLVAPLGEGALASELNPAPTAQRVSNKNHLVR